MKKAKQFNTRRDELTPEQSIRFLEDFSKTVFQRDLKTKLISLRVPENILNTFKTKSKLSNQKYQSVIVQLMREWVKRKPHVNHK